MQRSALISLGTALTVALGGTASAQARGVREVFRPHADALIVVAHRGCHRAAPVVGTASAPENSLAALENCVRIGVDMMEIDIRRSADGALVLLHDASVDRTTNGAGQVGAMPLAALQTLRLRDGLGGKDAAVTGERIATLDEMLAAARGRVLLNLDIKEPIHAEVIDAVACAGMLDQVIVKTAAGRFTAPLAPMRPFDRVPFAPILQDPGAAPDLGKVALRQAEDAAPIAFELPTVTPQQLEAVAAATRPRGIPLWVNTLWSGFVTGWGGDADALRDPDRVWGRLYRAGVRIFQTDEPEALIAFRAQQSIAAGGSRKP